VIYGGPIIPGRTAADLGHTKPENTYWYLEAMPELLELAAQRVSDAEHRETVSGCVDPRKDGGRLMVKTTEAVGGLRLFVGSLFEGQKSGSSGSFSEQLTRSGLSRSRNSSINWML
jgi:hypothetical protein